MTYHQRQSNFATKFCFLLRSPGGFGGTIWERWNESRPAA